MRRTKALKEILVTKKIVNGNCVLLNIENTKNLNTLSTTALKEIADILVAADKDSSIFSAIIYGGPKSFSVGSDLSHFKNKTAHQILNDQRHRHWKSIHRFKKPLIAAVNRFAIGSGCELALSCDIIIASEDCLFSHPEILIHLMPGAGGLKLMSALGKARAIYCAMTAAQITSEEAFNSGLVSKIVPNENTLSEALKIAQTFNKKSLPALLKIKKLSKIIFNQDTTKFLDQNRKIFSTLFKTKKNQGS
jgi:enoyl-CoA hydratase